MKSYVLVTPVRDEAATIGRTIAAVLVQTVHPSEWVIVSDGSTDATNAIVRDYARHHPWIRLLELSQRRDRNFAAVVHGTEAGIRHLATRTYDFIGLLDADVVFQVDYFEKLIRRFEGNPALGLAGGLVVDIGTKKRLPRNRFDVPGAVQFYRRECFEGLGGLCAIPEGGWDALSCAMARMGGFETELVTDLVVSHLKPRNSAEGGRIRRKWQMGRRDYALGYLFVFELMKCLGKLAEPPLVIGAMAWWIGYCQAMAVRRPRVVAHRIIAHLREEQRRRLRLAFGLTTGTTLSRVAAR